MWRLFDGNSVQTVFSSQHSSASSSGILIKLAFPDNCERVGRGQHIDSVCKQKQNWLEYPVNHKSWRSWAFNIPVHCCAGCCSTASFNPAFTTSSSSAGAVLCCCFFSSWPTSRGGATKGAGKRTHFLSVLFASPVKYGNI